MLLLCLGPLGTHGKLWDAATAGGAFVQEAHLPSSAQRGPGASNPNHFQLWLLADVMCKSGHGGKSLLTPGDPDG